jgi:cold shock protein
MRGGLIPPRISDPISMPAGKVKWFEEKKGHGFITLDSGEDAFVHYSDIRSRDKFKTLASGARVSCDVVTNGRKGLKAVNVRAAS